MTSCPAGSILVGVDGSPSSEAALMWAIDEAVRRGKPLHLLHARDEEDWWIRSGAYPPPELADRADPVLSSAVLLAEERRQGVKVSSGSTETSAAAALVSLSGEVDLVVVGSRGRGNLRGALLGSVSRQVAAHARCPVVAVHDETYRLHEHGAVVVGVDASVASSPAVEFAFAHAARRSVPLTAVHAWFRDSDEVAPEDASRAGRTTRKEQRVVTDALAEWRGKYPTVIVQEQVVRARPADVLVAASATAQLLVVGTRGAGGFRGLVLGSVSHRVLQRAHCPVAVVHPPQE